MTAHPHVEQGQKYAQEVVAGRVFTSKWVRKACERHLNDLERAEDDAYPYRFDPDRAERVLNFCHQLVHVKGEWAGDPFKAEPWQCFILMSVFGWLRKIDGLRRFRRVSVYCPRKNGKSLIASVVGLWMFAFDGEKGSEVYSLASTLEQATQAFNPARDMVNRLDPLKQAAQIRVYGGDNPNTPMKSMLRPDGSVFKPLTGSPGDGQSPSCAILDEVHQYKSDDGLQAMFTGMGARRQPIILMISTAGFEMAGPCWDDWKDCEKLLDGAHEDDQKFAIIFTVDPEVDWTSEAALHMANPNLGVSLDLESLRTDQQVAARDPTKVAMFKTKRLNLFVSSSSAWVNMEKWRTCESDTLKLDGFEGEAAWVGIDASSKTDLFSAVIAFKRGDETALFARHFLPEDTALLPENSRFRAWASEGWLTLTPGARVDQSIVEEVVREWSARFNIRELAYDPREMNDMALRISRWAGFPLVEINQSPALMSEPLKEFEALINSNRLRVQNDPILRWCASNGVLKEARGGGPTKLWFLTKPRHQDKIDPVVAAVMAVGRSMKDEGAVSGVLFL